MAIQNRRGNYSDFDPTKMVEGEFAVVQSGDPNTSDGKAVYIAPTTGTAERVALYKDLQQEVQAAITDATDEVIQEVTAGIIEGVAEDVTKAETAATNAEQSAQDAEASAEEAQEVLENKADNDGYYPSLYAGNLSSTKKQTDSVPYLFRKTAGGASKIGEREDDTLVGATVNVNQLVDADTSSVTIQSGHKYYAVIGGTRTIANSTGTAISVTGGTDMVTDLTAYFGSTIADYLYNLETATAGAGIAKLKEWGFFTGEYIPYNPGTLESVEATAHVMRDADENIIGNYNLGTDTLRGLFKLDSNNNLYADGDTKASDGTVTRKYGVVDLGTLNWVYEGNVNLGQFRVSFTDGKYQGNCICVNYQNNPTHTWNNLSNMQIGIGNSASVPILRIRDESYSDAAAFKAAMSGVMLVYELATPTTEQSTPFTSPQICDPDGTEEYVSGNGVPVGHETEYDYDIKGLAEELIDVPDIPSTNGTYVLKATRSASGISYEWVSST